MAAYSRPAFCKYWFCFVVDSYTGSSFFLPDFSDKFWSLCIYRIFIHYLGRTFMLYKEQYDI